MKSNSLKSTLLPHGWAVHVWTVLACRFTLGGRGVGATFESYSSNLMIFSFLIANVSVADLGQGPGGRLPLAPKPGKRPEERGCYFG